MPRTYRLHKQIGQIPGKLPPGDNPIVVNKYYYRISHSQL